MSLLHKVLFLLLLQILFLFGTLYAQSDSLLNEFNKIPKTAENISKLIDLSFEITDYNVDSALHCAIQIQQISIPPNNYELYCKSLINIGTISKISGNYGEANQYLSESLEYAEKHNLISCAIISLYQIGDLNRCIGLFDQSLLYLYLSKNLAHKNKVNQQHPELYDRISSTFFQLAENGQQIYKLTKIPNQNEFNLEKSTPQDYIKLCKTYADSALLFSELNHNNRTKLSSLNLLGAYYRHQQNYDKAIEYFGKAVELAKQTNCKIDISNYYTNIAGTYFAQKQYEKAIDYGLEAYRMAEELNILVYKSTAANILRLSYIEMKDFENALTYQNLEACARASMISLQNLNQIAELDKKYQTEQKLKEIEHQKNLLDLKNAEVFRRNIVIVCMLIAFIIIVVGIFYVHKQKAVVIKQKKEIHEKNEVLYSQKEKIEKQYKRLEKLDIFKESLTHTLVHDLKNPLSQIMLHNGNPTVQLSVQKMMRLITNMLDVEKYETTQFKLNKETHSLYELLHEIKQEHKLSLLEKNLNLILNFHDYKVKADKDLIMRVFDNLLSNAIRYSPLNSNIDVFAQNVDENTIQIGIKNYGSSIPEEGIPHIFDKYRNFEKINSSSHRSTGLGLAFCKMAVEAHQQKIAVRNEPDGVLFSFSLEGEKSKYQSIDKEENTSEIVLTETEKNILKPYFAPLENFEVYQISDILEVLNEIQQESENINAIKQQIINAAFAGNVERYKQIIHLVN